MQVIGSLKNISMASSKLLLAAKSLSVDPAAANAKNLLAAAARCLSLIVKNKRGGQAILRDRG